MKPKLQSKEFFLPLAGGTNTEGDPRLPGGPTIIVNNADFSVKGVLRKREGLAAAYTGNTNPANDLTITTGCNNLAISASGDQVILFGGVTKESTGVRAIDTTEASIRAMSPGKLTRETILTAASSTGACEYGYYAVNSAVSYNIFLLGTNCYRVQRETGELSATIAGVQAISHNGTANTVTAFAKVTGGNLYINAITNDNFTSAVNAAVTVTPGAPFQMWDVNIANRKIYAGLNGTANVVVGLINSATAVEVCSIVTAAGASNAYIAFNLAYHSDNTYILSTVKYTDSNANSLVNVAVLSANATNITVVNSDTITSYTLSTNDLYGTNTISSVASASNGNAGIYTVAYINGSYGTAIETMLSNFDGTNLSISSVGASTYGHTPITAPWRASDNSVYFAAEFNGARWWDGSPTVADNVTLQNYVVIFKVASSTTYSTPVAFCESGYRSTTNHIFLPPATALADDDGIVRYRIGAAMSFGSFYNSSAAYSDCVVLSFDNSQQNVQPVQFGDHLMIPGGQPLVYGSYTPYPMGVAYYPHAAFTTNGTNTDANFTNAGGNGTYYYCATYSFTDDLGCVHESAPSPSVSKTVSSLDANIYVMHQKIPTTSIYKPTTTADNKLNIYRTSANGNDFFLIYSGPVTNATTPVFYDRGTYGFSSAAGLSTAYTAKPLYTLNGTLPNMRARPHFCSCVHKGRYTYADALSPKTAIYYSKAPEPRIGPEFHDALQIICDPTGGEIKALASFAEKLWIFKQRGILATYGEPLNNAGVGSGYADPRIVTLEYGVAGQKSVAVVADGIYFISATDGLIYFIDQSERVSPVGGPVRHYCTSYSYNNIWVNPRESCVKFSSATVGAPTLSFNYKYGLWSTLTGRYALGTCAACAGQVGQAYTNFGTKYVDVLLDVAGKFYIQDPTAAYATTESYLTNVETSWIPLNDVAGYGKFYKWVLVGGRPSGNCNLILKTAYDYDPYWVDSQSYNATANINASPLSDHFGSMASNLVVDESLKIDVDGSRHKTDAVRLFVGDNNGTERNNVELVGVRLEVGVKPGRTKVGSARNV